MWQAMNVVVIAQIVVAAAGDIAFAFSVGATLLTSAGAQRRTVVRTALLAWLAAQWLALPLQASSMSGRPLTEVGAAIPLLLTHSHYGLMWVTGSAAGGLALIVSRWMIARRKADTAILVTLAIAGFAHAAMTHAADAREFSIAEIVHTAHLMATAGWAGVVITAAWPLRQAFSSSPSDVSPHTDRLSKVATLMFLVVVVTGGYDAHRGLGNSLSSMSTSLWGMLLAVKTLTVICITFIGAINRFVYLQSIRAGHRGSLVAFVLLLEVEAVLMVIVLTTATILGHSVPPADSVPPV
ncbi:copper resistance D family protein [Burkholderia sp. SCN-KJ]|uniref:copper resistance D family protein n=1 Tax=Burkholderia sp. SCN-KJ TaxID=2969248 RepID=UPI00214FBC9E|nr:CopD family protein [Burkholderia sp. SCN-KJ]MCR4470453.1 CopD family protein [Burkholderia sp. SCN-KJ]